MKKNQSVPTVSKLPTTVKSVVSSEKVETIEFTLDMVFNALKTVYNIPDDFDTIHSMIGLDNGERIDDLDYYAFSFKKVSREDTESERNI